MRHRKTITILCMLMMVTLLSTSAFAVSESDVESAIAASSQEEVAGNLFIWFLCAVSFLKISQKIDSFMTSLGINVGRTGGSMLAEMMIAGRTLGEAVKATGGAVGSIFNRGHSSNTTNATGQAFTGGGNGMLAVVIYHNKKAIVTMRHYGCNRAGHTGVGRARAVTNAGAYIHMVAYRNGGGAAVKGYGYPAWLGKGLGSHGRRFTLGFNIKSACKSVCHIITF